MPLLETTSRMLATYPTGSDVDRDALARCIEACATCSQACTQCADDCLSESNAAELAKAIRLNLDCADVCATTSRVIGRQTELDASLTRAVLEACAVACRSCGDECEQHASHMEHCAVCTAECRRCEQQCIELAAALA